MTQKNNSKHKITLTFGTKPQSVQTTVPSSKLPSARTSPRPPCLRFASCLARLRSALGRSVGQTGFYRQRRVNLSVVLVLFC